MMQRALRMARRWRVHPESHGGRWTGLSLNLISAGAAAASFLLFAPDSSWGQSVMIFALAAIAVIAFLAEARLKVSAAAYFDASFIVSLLALAIAGPLPALLVWVLPDLLSRFVLRRDPMLSPGLVATLSSLVLAVLAGALVLELAAAPELPAAAPALFSAGVVMWAVNFAVARLAFAPWYQGFAPSSLIRAEFLELTPAVLAMLAIGVAIAMLIPAIGVGALAPLALVIVLPQLGLAWMARARSVARLSRLEATKLYVSALADVLELSADERRKTICAADLLEGDSQRGERAWRKVDPTAVAAVVFHAGERWDGGGSPAGLRGGWAPVEARVLAVARAWSELTASGTVELTHRQALRELAFRAGSEFDPAAVAAAEQVVAAEQAFARSPDFEPRLHRLPLPGGLRQIRLPALLARLAEPA
jgi:hypothetical protein